MSDDNSRDDIVHVRTYTALWRMEKRLYKFYEWSLPFPVSIRQAVVGVLSFMVWFWFMSMLGVPFDAGFSSVLWLVPPAGLTWVANRPLKEGKKLPELLISQVGYLLQPHRWCDLTPQDHQPARIRLYAQVWVPAESSTSTTSEVSDAIISRS